MTRGRKRRKLHWNRSYCRNQPRVSQASSMIYSCFRNCCQRRRSWLLLSAAVTRIKAISRFLIIIMQYKVRSNLRLFTTIVRNQHNFILMIGRNCKIKSMRLLKICTVINDHLKISQVMVKIRKRIKSKINRNNKNNRNHKNNRINFQIFLIRVLLTIRWQLRKLRIHFWRI